MTKQETFTFTKSLEEENGFYLLREALSTEQIDQILLYLRTVIIKTPFFTPKMKNGAPFSIQITSIGSVGWISDEKGYRYQSTHPNGNNWSEIPDFFYYILQPLFDKCYIPYFVSDYDSCLVNLYKEGTSLGMHYDKDERDKTFPITSISIGRPAQFDIELGHQKKSYTLYNGDVLIMSGKSRNVKHGISKLCTDIWWQDNPLKDQHSRINLTLRKAL